MKKMVLIPYDQYFHSSIANNAPSPSIENEEINKKEEKLEKDLILQPFSKCHKKLAESLLTYAGRNVTWNEDGEIIVNGEVVCGSHITDLLKDALFNYKHFNPVGVKVFYESLKGVPLSLIKNPNRKTLIGRGDKEHHPLPPPGIPVGVPAINITSKKEVQKQDKTDWTLNWQAL